MKFGNGDINFGEKPSITWDTSIKTTKLSPEQIEQLKNGVKYEDVLTGNEVVTIEEYVPLKILHAPSDWNKRFIPKKEECKVETESIEATKQAVELKPLPVALTVELYKKLKAEGKTDKGIGEMFGLNHNQIHKFKKENNLVGEFNLNKMNSTNVQDTNNEALREKVSDILEDLSSVTNNTETVIKSINSNEDLINSPSHYTDGGIETIDYIEAKLTENQFEGYLAGNVIKYISRYQCKHGKQDLEKAQWYLNRLIEMK